MTRLTIIKINNTEYQVTEEQLKKLSNSKYKFQVVGGYDVEEDDYNSIAMKEHD